MQNSFDWLKNKLVEFGKLSPGRQLSLISVATLLLFLPVAVWITLQPIRLFSRAFLPATPPVTSPGTPGENTAVLSIEPELTFLGTGKETTLNVNIDAGTHEVTAAEVVLNYDGNIVSVLEVIPGDFLPVRLGEISIDNNAGRVQFAAGERPASIKKGGKGTLATLKVKSTGNIGSSQFYFAKPETQVAAVGWETSVLSYASPGWVHVKEAEMTSVLILFKFQGVSTQRPNQNVTYIVNSVESEQYLFKGESMAASDINGVYKTVLASVRPGKYDIFLKGPSQLSRFLGRHTVPTTGEYTINITDKPLLAGDIAPREQPRNDRISVADYSLMVTHFGSRMPSTGSPADLDFDGDVDIFDYNMIVSNFGKTGALYGEGASCPQVITPAKNPTTGECREFTTPCDVPGGWETVITCG